jgi:hypothetical protein
MLYNFRSAICPYYGQGRQALYLGHIDANSLAVRSDLLGRKQDVNAAAAAQVDYRFALTDR